MLDICESSLSYNIFIDQNVWHNLITTHMNQKEKVPVVILNGFFGSGKTTLFRNLISQSKGFCT